MRRVRGAGEGVKETGGGGREGEHEGTARGWEGGVGGVGERWMANLRLSRRDPLLAFDVSAIVGLGLGPGGGVSHLRRFVIHISGPTGPTPLPYSVSCFKKKSHLYTSPRPLDSCASRLQSYASPRPLVRTIYRIKPTD